MLEDLTMEKKTSQNWASLNPTKGIETKKPQDATSKQFSKSSRRRESPTSNATRSDVVRKPTPQKPRKMDKRSRPRGLHYSGGKESSQVEEYEAEVGLLYSTGNKKKNLNYMLNFSFEPRGESGQYGPNPSYKYGVRSLMSTQKHKYNKEQFLQANCQFVVRADSDYSPYLGDPDMLVNWDFIEQIRVASVEPVTCPICLSVPVAANMTRCGHIYCCPCILHYLHVAGKSWGKCPICFEAVHINDLKSVQVEPKIGLNVGQPITFQLMSREKGSLMACPVSQFEVRTNQKLVLSVSEKELDTAYAKLLTANPSEVHAMIDKEVEALEKEKLENPTNNLVYIKKALEMCVQRILNLDDNATHYTLKTQQIDTEIKGTTVQEQGSSLFKNDISCEAAIDSLSLNKNMGANEERNTASDNAARALLESSEGEDLLPSRISPEDIEAPRPTNQTKRFYFYQASDGQQIYLHAINVQMLEMTYGSLRESPAQLTGVIIEKDAGSMTIQLRKRLRYLQHLPVTAQFEVAEIDLLPPLVTQDTLDAFKDQLEKRKNMRQKRAREERKREKRIAEIELRQIGRHSTPHLRIDSFHHFPKCGISENDMSPPAPPRIPSTESSRASSPNTRRSPSPAPAALALDNGSSPSFAQMLRSSVVKPAGWGWSKANSQPSGHTVVETVDSEGESATAPGYRQSFRDAIATVFSNVSTDQDENDQQGRKKKKKKQKVLFATGMAMAYTSK